MLRPVLKAHNAIEPLKSGGCSSVGGVLLADRQLDWVAERCPFGCKPEYTAPILHAISVAVVLVELQSTIPAAWTLARML
jgi:hypothetical protein